MTLAAFPAKKASQTKILAALSAFSLLGLAACNGATSDELGPILGQDEVNSSPHPIPDATGNPVPNPDGSSAHIGSSCRSSDPNRICLSLNYVVYQNSSGTPVASQQQVLANLEKINSIWSQCNLAFEIGKFQPVDPADYGLRFNTSGYGELTSIRNTFVERSTLLVVTTGTWTGSLGAGAANAWAAMPGGGPYGVVLEEPVGAFGNIVAHELGHYLNLPHVNDSSDVMNPTIYQGSTKLTSSQCSAARSAAMNYWGSMLR